MSSEGTFEVEENDIVTLKPRGNGFVNGWVNIGVHAVNLQLSSNGDLTVRCLARTAEHEDLAVASVTRERAAEAGGIDPDAPDENCEDAPAP